MKTIRLVQVLCFTSVLSLLGLSSVQAEESPNLVPADTAIPRLHDVKQSAKTIKAWLAVEAATVTATGVKLERTEYAGNRRW